MPRPDGYVVQLPERRCQVCRHGEFEYGYEGEVEGYCTLNADPKPETPEGLSAMDVEAINDWLNIELAWEKLCEIDVLGWCPQWILKAE